MKEGFNLTMKEATKLSVIQSVIDHLRTANEASELLGICQRQVWRYVKRVKENGMDGIKNKNKFRTPPHAFSNEFKNNIIALKNSNDYCDTNFTHFIELLEERENIKISYSSLHNILSSNKIISKKSHKDKKTHRRRKRKECPGDLVQTDGTPYDWFNDGHMYSIHGFIDDATGNVLGLYMSEHECLLGYLEATRQMLTNFGVPRIVYPDKYSVFFPVKSQKLTVEEELEGKKSPTTQYMRIMIALGINMFPASSSQAKGRIERLWQTLQDRLITEFKLHNITSIEQANLFLPKYIPKYNKRFAIAPASIVRNFGKVPDYFNLDLLLSCKLDRIIDNAGTFTIQNKRFQIVDNHILPRVKVDIYLNKKDGIFVYYKDTKYNVICIDNVPNSYTKLNFNELCNSSKEAINAFVVDYLSYDAKEEQPILTSS